MTLAATWLPLCFGLVSVSASAMQPVKPPKIPHMNSEYVDKSKLKALKQPPELAAELATLGRGSIEDRVAKLKKKVIHDMIFVKGGTFMMGDFGPLWSPEKLPYSDQLASRPVHEVTLSSYSIAKYKTTYAEFDVYTDATRTPRAAPAGTFASKSRFPNVPAGVRWQWAKDYCKWLGTITHLPFDLPTEAQWEYAARSRGQFFVWATDDGNIDYGRNVPAAGQIKKLTQSSGEYDSYPVGLFPPNPLGLYDASHDGEEWVNDWYDKNYYRHSPKKDPQGPATGTMKVARGWPNGDSMVPNTMYRRERPLTKPPIKSPFGNRTFPASYGSQGLRCAVEQPTPLY